MIPFVSKIVTAPAVLPNQTTTSVAKAPSSTFADALSRAAAGTVPMGSHTSVSNLSAIPLNSPTRPTPLQTLRAKGAETAAGIQNLNHAVAALPPKTTFDGLRNRAANLESRYREIDAALKNGAPQNDPKQLLGLQHDIYQINEEMELMAKMIEQATGGVKSILQTQV
jgi:hypothetical protein